jgi:ribosomal protein L16 Arg81 hydroxylase
MIYIPPNVAHHGVSLEDSVSYSIGFKSIRYKNLLDQFATDLMVDLDDASFHDLQMPIAKSPFILDDYVALKVHAELSKLLLDKEKFKASLLKHLSCPKNIANEECDLHEDEIKKILKKRGKFKRDMWSKFVASKIDHKTYAISINSNNFTVTKESYISLESWFSLENDTVNSLLTAEIKNAELLSLVAVLIKNGVFYFS